MMVIKGYDLVLISDDYKWVLIGGVYKGILSQVTKRAALVHNAKYDQRLHSCIRPVSPP